MLEHLGANTLLHGVLKDTDIALVVSLDGFRDLAVGDVMGFSLEPDNLHFFNSETQQRVG